MTLQKALDIRLFKAKYLKRTGSPGHYKYIYKESKGRKKESFEMEDVLKRRPLESEGNAIDRYVKEVRKRLSGIKLDSRLERKLGWLRYRQLRKILKEGKTGEDLKRQILSSKFYGE